MLAEQLRGLAQPGVAIGRRGDRTQHRIRMADDIFGAGQDGEIDPRRDRREEQRRRPGIVEQRRDPPRLGRRDDRGNVLHLKGQAAGAFEEDRRRGLPDQIGDAGADQRIVEARGDAHRRQHLPAEGARRLVDAVHHQQFVAALEHREQSRRDRRHARGEQHRALGARFELGQRLGQRPLRRRAAPAVVELAIGVAAGAGLERGAILEQDGGGAVDGRVDDRPRPFGASAAGDDLGLVALAIVVAHETAFGVVASAPHSLHDPS